MLLYSKQRGDEDFCHLYITNFTFTSKVVDTISHIPSGQSI